MKKQYDSLGIIKKLSLTAVLIMALPAAFCSNSTEWDDNKGSIILPKEIVTYTFSYLPVEELGKMALVSKGFKEISEQDILWKDWIPGVNTKEEFVKHAIPRVMVYNLGNTNSIFISPYDLFPIVDSGRIFLNDCLYQANKTPFTNPKRELLSIIREIDPSNTPCITLRNDQVVELTYAQIEMYYYNVCFEKVEEVPPGLNLFASTPRTDMHWNGPEVGELYIKRLNCLSDNYNDLRFGSYWGHSRAFEELENLLPGLHSLTNASNDMKDEGVLFFVQKYVDFRAKDSSPWGDGSYAENYLHKVLGQIREAFHTDFLSTEYISPVEYVVANEALPEKIREYYSRPF